MKNLLLHPVHFVGLFGASWFSFGFHLPAKLSIFFHSSVPSSAVSCTSNGSRMSVSLGDCFMRLLFSGRGLLLGGGSLLFGGCVFRSLLFSGGCLLLGGSLLLFGGGSLFLGDGSLFLGDLF